MGLFSSAPFYAKNPQYIEQSVHNPIDYIVIDHIQLHQDLVTYGVDATTFWNIWRLTPGVYKKQDGDWVVKYEFNKLDEDLLADSIEYILTGTVDILLSIDTKKALIKTAPFDRKEYCELAQDEVCVYEKADLKSKVICTTPKGMTHLNANFVIEGLDGCGPYWHVRYDEEPFFSGYIHNKDTKMNANTTEAK